MTSDRHAARTRAALVVLQVAMSVALLAVTGLLSASLVRLLRADKGFTSDQVLAVGIAMPAERYESPLRQRAVSDRLTADLQAWA